MIHKIGFINGSPRRKNSCSQIIIDYFLKQLKDDYEQVVDIHVISLPLQNKTEILTSLLDCDVLVVVSPLYVDSLPSHLLSFLKDLDTYQKAHLNSLKNHTILYSFINCGFMDGHQTHIALSILENFATHMHFTWGGGVGLGSGEMFKNQINSIPPESRMQKPIFDALGEFINTIKNQTTLSTPTKQLLVSQNFSTRLFILMGNFGWFPQATVALHKMYKKPYLHHK